MVTLVTCHPYKSHGRYRYLVYCVRDNGEKEEKKEKKVKTMTGITYESSKKEIEKDKWIERILAVIVLICILRSFWDKNEIFHRVYIIDDYYVTAKNGSRFLFPADKYIFLYTEK